MKAQPKTYPSWHGFDFHAIWDIISHAREVLWAIGILVTGAIWVVNYFATREQLERLDCDRKVNERMLTAHGNLYYARQLAEAERATLVNLQQELDNLRQTSPKDPGNAELQRTIQLHIQKSENAIRSYDENAATEARAEQSALNILVSQKGCDTKEHREATARSLNP